MFSIVDRYLARNYLTGYFILVLVGMGLYVLLDLLVNLDEFTKEFTSLPRVVSAVFDYYVYNIPLYFSQIAGPMMAVAASFTLAMMLRNNELTALISTGMPLSRLSAPILLCSVALILVWVANRELLLPQVAPKIVRSRDDVAGTKTIGVYCVRDENNAIVTALRLYPREGRMYRLFIIAPDATGRPAQLIEADSAAYDAQRKVWVLERGRKTTMPDPIGEEGLGQRQEYEFIREYPLTMTPEDMVLRQATEWSDLLSTAQMNALVQSRKLPNRAAVVMSRHIRLTQPLLQLILIMLVFPFFLTREPTSVLAAGGRSLLTGGAFFTLAFVAHNVIEESNAALIAWMPILAFGPFAVVRLANVKT